MKFVSLSLDDSILTRDQYYLYVKKTCNLMPSVSQNIFLFHVLLPFAHGCPYDMYATFQAVGGSFPLFLTDKSLFTFLSTKI